MHLKHCNKLNREEKQVFISIDQDEHSLSILVEDNGIGIDPDNLSSIFENGYSTKGKLESRDRVILN